ncbi:hypothetical protein [Gulosibacter molinativorax]|uniref:MFS transporter n=1 Tax=Gulosibacter molinativorax TaxID=256821 RepID=A0ABT7CBK3_9MICO|nr:hypothetical protein [Gulosibacter molinativorax]MDJ1372016.1 hypothetical protein [Gulosibacter molinativorax]QUY60740.1 Hypotetical protein [Gulosibacter molinativorax]
MSKSAQSFFYRILVPAPFILAVWVLVAWLVLHQSVSGFLSLFIMIPAAFIQMAVLGFQLWLRPSIRLSRAFTAEDAWWYFGTFAAWAIAAALPSQWGGLVAVAAFIIGAIGMSRIGQRSRQEAVDTMTERADRMRDFLNEQNSGPLPRPKGPGAGRIIIVDTSRDEPQDTNTEWEERGPATNPRRKPIEGEILRDDEDDDPDVEEWQARPHSN